MTNEKADFIQNQYITILKAADPATKPKWGKMNFQQMVEHVNGFFKVSTEKIQFPVTTPTEHLPKYHEFLYSDKEFKENTKAPAGVVPDEPLPVRCATVEEAINKLDAEIKHFFDYFKNNPDKKTTHPAFAELNYEEWVLLHYKHVVHHLKQFGLM